MMTADQAENCVHGNPPSFCDFCLSPVDDVIRVLRESSNPNLSHDACNLLASRIVRECLRPRLQSTPADALVKSHRELYEAANKVAFSGGIFDKDALATFRAAISNAEKLLPK
jgi:hypothetical protein